MSKKPTIAELEELLAIGRRILLLKPHPWAGHVGTVRGIIQTLVGKGLEVRLDNECSTTVFDAHEISIVT